MTIKISDFQNQGTEDKAPNYKYAIHLKNGETVEKTGYFVINSLFAAICRGEEGVIYWAVPTEQFDGVENLGPVSEGWGGSTSILSN